MAEGEVSVPASVTTKRLSDDIHESSRHVIPIRFPKSTKQNVSSGKRFILIAEQLHVLKREHPEFHYWHQHTRLEPAQC